MTRKQFEREAGLKIQRLEVYPSKKRGTTSALILSNGVLYKGKHFKSDYSFAEAKDELFHQVLATLKAGDKSTKTLDDFNKYVGLSTILRMFNSSREAAGKILVKMAVEYNSPLLDFVRALEKHIEYWTSIAEKENWSE